MSKIDQLSNHIKKFTKSYSDILVGIHTDLSHYKNDVITQSSKTTEAIKLLDSNLEEIEQFRNESSSSIAVMIDYHNKALHISNSLENALASFKKDKDSLEKQLEKVHEEFLAISGDHKKLDLTFQKLNNQVNSDNENFSDRIDLIHKELENEVKNAREDFFQIKENYRKLSSLVSSNQFILEKEIESVSHEIYELNSTIKNNQKTFDNEIKELSTSYQGLKSDNKTLKEAIDENHKKINSLNVKLKNITIGTIFISVVLIISVVYLLNNAL